MSNYTENSPLSSSYNILARRRLQYDSVPSRLNALYPIILGPAAMACTYFPSTDTDTEREREKQNKATSTPLYHHPPNYSPYLPRPPNMPEHCLSVFTGYLVINYI